MKRLKKLREQRGMTVKELASFVGSSTSTIYGWENTDTFPQVSELKKISELLHVTVDYLVENTDTNLYCDETIVSRIFVAAQIKINQAIIQTTSQVISLTTPLIMMDDSEIMDLLKKKIRASLTLKDCYDIEITSLVELSPVTMSSYAFPQMQIQMSLN